MAQSVCCPTIDEMLSLSESELATVDPVVMNLVVAKGISQLAELDIAAYVALADEWADDLRRRLPDLKRANFDRQPQKFKNDIGYYLFVEVAFYIDEILGVTYREDQKNLDQVYYRDPADLFLHGVMDTRRGTCGNMALLNVVLGRRIGLPVSLACLGPHFTCRYDDGEVTYNIEATNSGYGGVSSHDDEYMLSKQQLPTLARDCGSDLRALRPREMLAVFVAARARYYDNTKRYEEAESDYLLARWLFPRNRYLHTTQIRISTQRSTELFELHEKGHPIQVAAWFQQLLSLYAWKWKAPPCAPEPSKTTFHPTEKLHGSHVELLFEALADNDGDLF